MPKTITANYIPRVASPDDPETLVRDLGNKREIKFDFDFGDDLDSAVAKFGAKAIYDLYVSAGTVDLQNVARNLAGEGLSDAEIQDDISARTPGVKGARKASLGSTLSEFGKMSADEQAAFLEKLQARMQQG